MRPPHCRQREIRMVDDFKIGICHIAPISARVFISFILYLLTPFSSCFVQFLADHFVSEPATHFQMGRTVMAKVWITQITYWSSRELDFQNSLFGKERNTIAMEVFLASVFILSSTSDWFPVVIWKIYRMLTREARARSNFPAFPSLQITLRSFPTLSQSKRQLGHDWGRVRVQLIIS